MEISFNNTKPVDFNFLFPLMKQSSKKRHDIPPSRRPMTTATDQQSDRCQ